MKKSSETLRRMLAIALCVATIGSAGMTTAVGSFVGLNTSVSASNTVIVTYGDFTYYLYSDHTAEIASYNGTKDLSTKSLGCPSVVYAKDLDQYYFNGYTGSYTITRLQASAFNGCKIRILSLPNSLQTIFDGFWNAEIGCFSISTNNSYFTTDSSGVLYNKSKTTLMAYPSKPSLYGATSGFFLANTCTKIDNWALTNCKLTSITVPSTVTYVGRGAFQKSSIQTITFEGSPDFWEANADQVGTFDDASSLYKITINGTSGNYATDSYGMLYNKTKTKLLLCPYGKTSAFSVASTCTEIGAYAFQYSNCNGPVILDQVTKINDGAFYGKKSNFKVYCLKGTATETYCKNNNIPYAYHYEYTTASNGVTITGYHGPYAGPSMPAKILGKPVVAIGAEAFKGNTTLQGVYSLPSTLTSVGDSAFYGCTSLKNLSLPSAVTSIGKKAFYNTAITSFYIPTSMTTIGEEAFYGMKKLEKVTIPSKVTSIATYAFGFDSSLTSVSIPNNVTSVGFASFYGCSNLESLTIGTGLKTIGTAAFCNTALTSQYIPITVTSVGGYAFGYKYVDNQYTRENNFTEISGYPSTAAQTYCTNYNVPFKSLIEYKKSSDNKSIIITKYTGTETSLTIPSKIDGLPVTSIEKRAFNGNTTLQTITLPDTMTTVSPYAFYGTYNLKKVVLPSTITSIGGYAFEFCNKLTTINFPGALTSIGNGAFYGCTSLTSVSLSSTALKSLGSSSFCNTGLTSVTLPKTVTSIGDHAFGFTYKDSEFAKVSGFTITGYAYTAADTYATNNYITFNPLYETLVNNTTITNTVINLGESIKINFASTGGKKPITYAAMYSLDGGSSVSICSYSENTSATFTPTKAGTYTIYTYAKDDKGNFIRKDLTLTVETLPVQNTSTIWIGENEGQTNLTVDDTVGIAASATGGNGVYKYSVYYHKSGSNDWQTAIEDTTKTNISFHLSDENGEVQTGYYEINVVVFDTDGKTSSKNFLVNVYDRLVNDSYANAEEVTVGEEITGYLGASGGAGDYTYTVKARYNGGEWTTLAENITKDFYSYSPSLAGVYDVEVTVKDSIGTTAVKEFTFTVKEESKELQNTSTISVEGEVYKNDVITIYASAKGGTAPYTYAAYCKKTSDTKWTTLQNFSTNANIEFALTDVANYEVCVKVKDAAGTVEKKYYELSVITNGEEELANTSKMSAETIGKGESVTLTGSATGGAGSYTYSFLYKKKTDTKWTTKQGFAANNVVSITPANAVAYDVCIKVKDADGTIVKKFFDLTVTEKTALTNNSKMDTDTIVKGDSVVLTGKATGGTGGYTYSFLYKKNTDTKWTTKQGFTANNVVSITPASAVVYDVCIKVKDSAGTIEKKFFTLTVTEQQQIELQNNSTIVSLDIVKGQDIIVNCEATGGSSPYTYAVLYKKAADTKWTTKQNFTANTSVNITPASVTEYDVCVKVKDSTGAIVKKFFKVNVTNPEKLTSTSTISATTITKGQTVTVYGVAVGGKSPYTYAVLYKKAADTKWTTKQNFDTNDTVTVKPASATDYDVCIKIKDAEGTIVKHFFKVTVK